MYAVTGGYPYFIQAYGKEVTGCRACDPDHPTMSASRSLWRWGQPPSASSGSRYERATPAERDYRDVAAPWS